MSAATTTARVVRDMDEAEYHASPGLSATGMKHLLRSPLHYRRQMDHRPEKSEWDFGHGVHAKVLGVGAEVVEIPADVLSKSGSTGTDAARAFMKESREAGLIPLKADAIASIDRCAEAVLANTKARRLLELEADTELSLFATDPETGVALRGRLDRLAVGNGIHLPLDLKTSSDVRRLKIRRSIEDFGYDIQAEAYRELLRLAMGIEARPMQLIFVESDEPHEVRVVQLAHEDWVETARLKMRRAIRLYAACMDSGKWPGEDDHTAEVEAIEPRPFYLADHQHLEEVAS